MGSHLPPSPSVNAREARVPLWVWFIAAQWMDFVWSVLVLMGIEKLRIVPGFTQANALDLYYMPYTHSLPGSIVLFLIFGAIVALFASGNRATTILPVVAVSFSHWILDLVVHTPDLPLHDNAAKAPAHGRERRLGKCKEHPLSPNDQSCAHRDAKQTQ